MRCTQFAGINDRAREFLNENRATVSRRCGCPDCKTEHWETFVIETYDEENGRRRGMFDDGPDLDRHLLKDGRWAYEYVQAVPWSSGPVIFLSLRWEDGTSIDGCDWTDSEIEHNT